MTDDIVAALKTVYDPEIPVDIYELGLIYKVDIDDDRNVPIDMTLTAPGCPVAGDMPGWVENAVGRCRASQLGEGEDRLRSAMGPSRACRMRRVSRSMFGRKTWPPRRPRPKVMTLTDAAAARIRQIMARADGRWASRRGEERRLRRHGIHDGMGEGQKPFDEVIEDKGVKVLIDAKASCSCSAPRWTYQSTPEVGLCFQQPEPDFGMRLRRERTASTGNGCTVGLTLSS